MKTEKFGIKKPLAGINCFGGEDSLNNIVSYAENALESFKIRNFCSVDSLILSWISYIRFPSFLSNARNWTGVKFSNLFCAEYFNEMFGEIHNAENSKKLFTAMAASPRFRDIKVLGYSEQLDETEEKQFSAVCFQLNPTICYIAFRGTDSTLIGWKEDFNMAFKFPIPAQEEAVKYLTEASKHITGQIKLGGHSKGGNLAVYSAANCNKIIQKRINSVYSHDGPGFSEEVLKSEPFIKIAPKTEKTIPQSSIIGMLLEDHENFKIVKSLGSNFMQHDPFTWEVKENEFSFVQNLTPKALYIDRTLTDWILQMSEEERKRFVDSLYEILTANNISTVDELKMNWKKNAESIFREVSQMDSKTRNFMLRTLLDLAALSIKNFPELLKKTK